MKVTIVCGSPSTEMLAPFEDPSWEIWVLGNRVHRYLDKRITRIFEIHDNLSEHGDVGAYKSKLLQLSKKYSIIVGEEFLDCGGTCPGVEIYPYKEVEKMYGHLYLTSSPAYMIAYALLMSDVTDIAIYGVDLSVSDHEYFWQRPCVEAWIGFAKGRGVNVFIPEQSHVGKCSYVEGRHWNGEKEAQGAFTEQEFIKIAEEHNSKIQELRRQKKELDLTIAAHDGAIQVYTNLAKVARAIEAKIDVKSLTETTLLR